MCHGDASIHGRDRCWCHIQLDIGHRSTYLSSLRISLVQVCYGRSEVVAGSSSAVPGCLANLLTLTIPVEHKVARFREEFSHAMEDVRSRVTRLLGRTEEVGRQTSSLGQRADMVEAEVVEVRRQQSDLSDKLDRSLSESEVRQAELEQQAVDLEVRTTLLEEREECDQRLTSEMKNLVQQMQEMKERVELAESDAAKVKIKCDDMEQQAQNSLNRALLSQADRETLLHRLKLMEQKLQGFESHFPGTISFDCTPKRSVSSP